MSGTAWHPTTTSNAATRQARYVHRVLEREVYGVGRPARRARRAGWVCSACRSPARRQATTSKRYRAGSSSRARWRTSVSSPPTTSQPNTNRTRLFFIDCISKTAWITWRRRSPSSRTKSAHFLEGTMSVTSSLRRRSPSVRRNSYRLARRAAAGPTGLPNPRGTRVDLAQRNVTRCGETPHLASASSAPPW